MLTLTRVRSRGWVIATAFLALITSPSLIADPGIIDVTAYGATPNNPADDDTGPIQAAINAAAATGSVVYFPKGQYDLDGTLQPNLASGRVNLRGAGMEISILAWRRNVNGIQASYTTAQFYDRSPLTISDLTLASSNGNGASALFVSFVQTGAISIVAQTVRVFNVEIRPEPQLNLAAGWGNGVYLNNAWNAHLNDLLIQYPVANGIELEGQSNDVSLSKVKIFGRNAAQGGTARGILIGQQVEGPIISHATILGVGKGIDINTTCNDILPGCRPSGFIDNNFINAEDIGITVWNHNQVGITSNLIYQGVPGPAGTPLHQFIGIYFSNAGQARLSGNNIGYTGSASGASYGIVGDMSTSSITGTVIDNFTNTSGYYSIGMFFPPTSSRNTIVGNIMLLQPGTTFIANQGTGGNILSANTTQP